MARWGRERASACTYFILYLSHDERANRNRGSRCSGSQDLVTLDQASAQWLAASGRYNDKHKETESAVSSGSAY